MHLEKTTNTFFLAGIRVENGHTRLNFTGVDTGEGKVTDVWVRSKLEYESGERLFVVTWTKNFLFFVIRVCTFHRWNINRTWEVVNYCVEQRLHTHVTECGTAEYWYDRTGDGGLTYCSFNLFSGEFFTTEVFFEKSFVFFCNSFHHFHALFVKKILQVSRNFFDFELSTFGSFVVVNSFTGYEVNDALEVIFSTDWNLERDRLSTETIGDHAYCTPVVGTDTVHFVDEADTRNAVAVSLTPYGFRLRLNACNSVKHANSTIKYTQGTFYFHSEVNVTRSIDDVYAVVIPETGGCSRGNGDTTLFFLFHPVHGGLTFVCFTNFVRHTGVIENTFSSGSLTRINVGHDTNVSLL